MKFIALILALLPSIVHAEHIVGRVRTDAVAKMEVLQASGIYQNVKSVEMAALKADGFGPVGYKLTIDGQEMNFKLVKVGKDNGCGVINEAVRKENHELAASTTLELNDLSRALCERVMPYVWEVKLETRPFHASQASTLLLGGNPEYVYNTL